MLPQRLAVVLAVLGATAAPVAAQSVEDATSVERTRALTWRLPIVVVENAIIVGPPLYDYWRTVDEQKEDWELDWSWSDWKSKLFTTDELVLDTNRFEANGMRHPLAGALAYQTGRANGLGVIGSTLVDFANAAVWEYLAEYREKPSINDLFANTAAGFLVGEPLFQIGTQVDRRSGLIRRGITLVASPFHRVQKELGLSPLGIDRIRPHRFELLAGSNATRYGDSSRLRGEVRLGIDLELARDFDLVSTQREPEWSGLAGWNRVAFELRFGGVALDGGLSGGRFRSRTTYTGRVTHRVDDDAHGLTTFVGIAAGFDVMQRRLPDMTDRFAIFELVEPTVAGWWRAPHTDVDLELAIAADVAMVESFARGAMPLVDDASILVTRGYYYATGASVHGRLRARHDRWSGELETTAHRLWSFDEHSYGGDMDPKDLVDSRVLTTLSIGIRPTEHDLRVEVFGNALLRRGTGTELWRSSKELDAGLGLRTAF